MGEAVVAATEGRGRRQIVADKSAGFTPAPPPHASGLTRGTSAA
jgi:hypothetical protein